MDALRMAVDSSRRVLLKAEGNPARVIAYGIAAGMTFVGVGVGCYAYNIKERVKTIQRRSYDR